MVLQTSDATANAAGPARPESPAGRIVAQRTLFTGPTPEAPESLYSVAEKGVMLAERNRVILDGHARVSTNTYFGRFPAPYWQRWTSVRSVDVDVTVSGSGRMLLKASDSNGEARTVAHVDVADANQEPLRLTTAVDRFIDGGALWLEFETTVSGLTVENARWSVSALTSRTRRSTAIVICTFNRVNDCLATLATLASDEAIFSEIDAVYVVDQGTDTLESRPAFEQLRERYGDVLHYIRQPNLGGAGGFTRGIYEAVGASDEPVNLLLMDDDIRLEPDTVLRLRALADRADEPMIVGGQMLKLLHPDRLHVGAETVDLGIPAGKPASDALVDADLTEEQQDVRVDGTYNAWWTCLVPSEVVAAIGYPLPLFFQWDDIEFGLRAREAGFPTTTLPGAGVWHTDFLWKNWDDWSRYFSFRNSLITSALHSEFDRRRIVYNWAGQLVQYLVSMRYGLAALMIRAAEDFLRGPDVLADGGAETVAAVRKLWSDHPETATHPAHAVPDLVDVAALRTPAGGKPSMMKAVLAKRILWQLLRKVHGSAAVPSVDEYWWHVSLFEAAVVTDPSQEGVRVRRFDRELMVELGRQGSAVLWRLLRDGERVRDEYRMRLPQLTSRETWARLFERR
jgi:galactofuranosylgalactofuranosylrhamnosyl-N-acetylglucosaminyl-diphospho-decaprenol beta-1,5/1,6-galactofuranosyltransferase